jgi:hypothetical protein
MSCLVLFMQLTPAARHFARARAGSNIAARMAMIAITTNNSIRVNALLRWTALFAKFTSNLMTADCGESGRKILKLPRLARQLKAFLELIASFFKKVLDRIRSMGF